MIVFDIDQQFEESHPIEDTEIKFLAAALSISALFNNKLMKDKEKMNKYWQDIEKNVGKLLYCHLRRELVGNALAAVVRDLYKEMMNSRLYLTDIKLFESCDESTPLYKLVMVATARVIIWMKEIDFTSSRSCNETDPLVRSFFILAEKLYKYCTE